MKEKSIFKILAVALPMTAFLFSCRQEENKADVADPVVEITATELEGLPGESVNLTAKVTDDKGIQYILVESADWEFSQRIDFSSQNYIKEYNLTQSVIIPDEVKRGTTGEVTVRAFDFADKTGEATAVITVTAEPARLSIVQEMGFAITIAGKVAKVTGNDVEFIASPDGIFLPVKMTLTSNSTKLKTLTIKSADFGVDETIDLAAISTDEGKTATIDKSIALTSKDDLKHTVTFTLNDEKGTTAEYAPTVAVKATFEGTNLMHSAMFIQDKAMDMDKVVFGQPVLAERKTAESYKFTGRVYAERAGTEIFLVTSVKADEQTKYGLSNDGEFIIRTDSPNPIVLPETGYYEISVNLLEGTFSTTKLDTPEKSAFEEMYFVFGWGDYPAMSQTDPVNCPSRWSIDYNLQNGGCDAAFGKGGGVWIVAAGSDTNHPEVWLLKEDKAKYPEYNGWFFDTALPSEELGECTIVFDNYLMKAWALKK